MSTSRENIKRIYIFIAKCLTLSVSEKNTFFVEKILKSQSLDWDYFIKIGSKHLILPSLYFNLERASMLKYVNDEVATYLKYVAEINQNRNKEILRQINEINSLFIDNEIKPIFFKGSSYLIYNLFNNIGERMIGDIDLIVSEDDCKKAFDLLIQNDYEKLNPKIENFPGHRHLPRLIKKNRIAAVEIHNQITLDKYSEYLNYNVLIESPIIIDDKHVPNYENQLLISIISDQINDDGFELKSVSLRSSYDVLLLSKRINAKKSIKKIKKLENIINCYFSVCYYIFGEIDSLKHYNSNETEKHLNLFMRSVITKYSIISPSKKKYFFLKIKRKLVKFFKSIFISENRKWLFNKLFKRDKSI